MSEFYERWRQAIKREQVRTFTEAWKSLGAKPVKGVDVTYGGRQCGKSLNMLQKIAAKYIAIDYGVNDRSVATIWSVGADGTLHVHEILTEDIFKPPEPPAKPKKAAKPAEFFPTKIGRIAKMPRYPGTWG